MERMETDCEVTRESVLKLIERKDEIERKLRELKEILDSNNVGMTEELVDSDGFPRHDIDVYQVRHARHQVICLQNDHKAIMQEIEKGLHAIHSQTSDTLQSSSQTPKKKHEVPIAKVNLVDLNSPAALAGLMVDDFIVEFGSVNYDNFKSLQDIGTLVQHSVGKSIPLTVKRNNAFIRVALTPKEWSGKGLLGCNILPIENVER